MTLRPTSERKGDPNNETFKLNPNNNVGKNCGPPLDRTSVSNSHLLLYSLNVLLSRPLDYLIEFKDPV